MDFELRSFVRNVLDEVSLRITGHLRDVVSPGSCDDIKRRVDRQRDRRMGVITFDGAVVSSGTTTTTGCGGAKIFVAAVKGELKSEAKSANETRIRFATKGPTPDVSVGMARLIR